MPYNFIYRSSFVATGRIKSISVDTKPVTTRFKIPGSFFIVMVGTGYSSSFCLAVSTDNWPIHFTRPHLTLYECPVDALALWTNHLLLAISQTKLTSLKPLYCTTMARHASTGSHLLVLVHLAVIDHRCQPSRVLVSSSSSQFRCGSLSSPTRSSKPIFTQLSTSRLCLAPVDAKHDKGDLMT